VQGWADAASGAGGVTGGKCPDCGVASAWLGGDYKIYVPGSSIQVFETMSIFTFPIAIMAVMTNITAVNRLREAGKALEAKESHLFVTKLLIRRLCPLHYFAGCPAAC
jgi:hypothetical protein